MQKGKKLRSQTITGMKDAISQPIYDTQDWKTTDPAGQEKLYFQEGINQNKTLFETNMRESGQLSAGQYYELRGFSMVILDPVITPAEFNNLLILSRAYLIFRLLDKDYITIPCYYIPAFNMMYDQAVTSSRQLNNVPYLKLRKVIPIRGKQSFSGVVKIQTALTAIGRNFKIALYMHGDLWRSVQ